MEPCQRVKVIRPRKFTTLMIKTTAGLGVEPYTRMLAQAVARRAQGRSTAAVQAEAAADCAQRKPCGGVRGEAVAALATLLYQDSNTQLVFGRYTHPAAAGGRAAADSASPLRPAPKGVHPAWVGLADEHKRVPSPSPVLTVGAAYVRRNSGLSSPRLHLVPATPRLLCDESLLCESPGHAAITASVVIPRTTRQVRLGCAASMAPRAPGAWARWG